MSGPRFTAVIPLHNKARTVERTLRSIAAQTYGAEEIVAVDDASTDGSAELAAGTGIANLRIERRDSPGPGGYPARNLGVETARTEWVGFLDADDEWLPHHLARAAEVIGQHPEANTLFFGRSIVSADYNAKITVGDARIYSRDELVNLYAKRNVFHVNALLIRREAYLATGGFRDDRGWRRGGDSELWLRLIDQAGPVFLSPEITTVYDMDFSDVIGNPKNFLGEHPVYRTCREMMATSPELARPLRQLSNRKTVEWIRAMPNRQFGRKLSLMAGLYPSALDPKDGARVLRSLLTRW